MKEIYKFWGTSVDYLEQVANIIVKKNDTKIPHACVSAFSWVTDLLINLIENAKKWILNDDTIKELKDFHYWKLEKWIVTIEYKEIVEYKFSEFFDAKIEKIKLHLENIIDNWINHYDHDVIIWFWEQISAYLLSEIITCIVAWNDENGLYVDLWEIVTEEHKKADKVFLEDLRVNIAKRLIDDKKSNEIPIIWGFIWKVPWWILNSIDRGYTDFTSALVASVVQAKKLIIFKEVDWICTADPRIVWGSCLLLDRLSYIEVLKMASAWMKAINTEAVKPAMKDNIPIEVRNTFYPENPWTLITAQRDLKPNHEIQTIPSKRWICIVRFWGYESFLTDNLWIKLLELIDKHRLKKFFSTSDSAWYSVALAYDKVKIEALKDDLIHYANVKFTANCAIVWIVWEEMQGQIWVFAKAANAISWNSINIHMVAQWASELLAAFVIDEKELDKAIISLHQVFFWIEK